MHQNRQRHSKGRYSTVISLLSGVLAHEEPGLAEVVSDGVDEGVVSLDLDDSSREGSKTDDDSSGGRSLRPFLRHFHHGLFCGQKELTVKYRARQDRATQYNTTVISTSARSPRNLQQDTRQCNTILPSHLAQPVRHMT